MPKLNYRLALDLGTNSIGWAVIRLDCDDRPCEIIKLGSRIFGDGRHPKTGASLAVDRRLARQMRRRRDRLLKRKRRMQEALIALGFLPTDATQRKALVTLDPYALRARGLDQALSGAEFGRALLHLNQRRGFKSNRKTDKRDNDSGALKSAIKELREELNTEGCRTLGEWLAYRHANGKQVRARLTGKTVKERAYNFYADRSMIEQEFDTLWKTQAGFNASLFSDKARDELKDILLFQRKLQPVMPGRCTLEPELHRAPLALPSTQRFRILQELNNLRIVRSDLQESPLTLAQRNTLYSALERSKELTFNRMRNRLLKLPENTRFNLEGHKRDRLKGNSTSVLLGNKNVLGDTWHALDSRQQDAVVENLLEVESEKALSSWLQANIGANEGEATSAANTSLPAGYGSLSREALSRVLPALEASVVSYAEAVARAGYHSHSQLDFGTTTGEVLSKLPYYGIPLRRHVGFAKDNPRNDEERYGKIANPTVHIGLNQIRTVGNALIKRYGHPAEIHLEVARELKLSRERKLELERDQKRRQTENAQHLASACDVLGLSIEGIGKNTRRTLIQKMRLWVELNPDDCLDRRCPFSGEQISIQKLLSDEVEIEHLLPFSQTLDDSMNNKTVALRRANRLKGSRSPYEAFGDGAHISEGYNYDDILLRANKMRNRSKIKRFAADAMDQWRGENDFLARAITDTSYLARVARQYLCCICPQQRVVTVPGRLTAILRGHYGLNRLLAGSAVKNRDDHRHHAIDAAVIGITDRSLLQRVATASARARELQLNRLISEMPVPWAGFRDQVAHAIEHLIVSHRPDHGYQGQMHEETAWGFSSDGKATRYDREKGQRLSENKALIAITEPTQIDRHGQTKDGAPRPYKGYVGGSNYSIEIWRNDKGKWQGDVITTFQAYQQVREHGEAEAVKRLRNKSRTLAGEPLSMRLSIGDCVDIDGLHGRQTLRVTGIRRNGKISLAPLHESNVDARDRDKADPFRYVYKTASSLMKSNARFVTISPIGKKNVHARPCKAASSR